LLITNGFEELITSAEIGQDLPWKLSLKLPFSLIEFLKQDLPDAGKRALIRRRKALPSKNAQVTTVQFSTLPKKMARNLKLN
jgi:hypothetical protein